MLAMNQIIKSQKNRQNLTTKEKDIIIEVYNNSINIECANFKEIIVSYKIKRINSSIPLALVGPFLLELETKKLSA